MMAPVLQVDGLCRHHRPRFGGAAVGISEVSLCLHAGQALGVTGRSGAGKSTLGQVLARLAPLDAGQIWMDGQEIGHLPPRRFAGHALRGALQMLLQDAGASLIAHMSGREVLADAAARLCPGRPVSDEITHACAAAGFPAHLLGRLPHEMSQGQAVRLALARALIAQPRILILDEPTAALDAGVRAGLMQRLDLLRRERGMGLVIISHDLHLIRLMCTQIMVLAAGRVVETGDVAEVLAHPAHPDTQALVAAMPRLGA